MERFDAGSPFPPIGWPSVGGGSLTVAREPGWRMLVVYRGRHCGLCRKYLRELDDLLERFTERAIAVYAVSADARDKAEDEAREERWRFRVAYDMTPQDMRRLGLYVSPPTNDVDHPFAEPALFVVNPDGKTQVVAVTNAPFSRPELRMVLEGLKTAQDEHAPIHGTGG
jgi:peroxiredoxin